VQQLRCHALLKRNYDSLMDDRGHSAQGSSLAILVPPVVLMLYAMNRAKPVGHLLAARYPGLNDWARCSITSILPSAAG